jgi:pyruvate,water dikinase
MYRDLGFEPDPALDEEGIWDLICGRPYCNLSREPAMYSQGLPLEHSFAVLKDNPQKALYPQAQPNWSRAGWRFWLFLPRYLFRSMLLVLRLRRELKQFPARFREAILPVFAKEVARATRLDLSALSNAAILEQLEHWLRLTLSEFARDSLKPTLLAAQLLSDLEQFLAKALGPARSKAALQELSMGARPDAEADLAQALHDLAGGTMDRATFLDRFGHRGSHEMELASPRWAEAPTTFDHPRTRATDSDRKNPDLMAACTRIAEEAQWTGRRRKVLANHLHKQVQWLQTFIGLRETAKHYWMQGYALIRRLLVELDRRYGLGGGIFYLLPNELPSLVAGEALSERINERRRRRRLALSLEVPPVLFSDDLEAIGRPLIMAGGETLHGVPLSAGVAEGPALVLHEPSNVQIPEEPYILVCPSTDPAWVPLFVHARGLVLETGGVLSHGAIVAREFGLPAVAGLPGIHRRLASGQRLRVDGTTGRVTVICESSG